MSLLLGQYTTVRYESNQPDSWDWRQGQWHCYSLPERGTLTAGAPGFVYSNCLIAMKTPYRKCRPAYHLLSDSGQTLPGTDRSPPLAAQTNARQDAGMTYERETLVTSQHGQAGMSTFHWSHCAIYYRGAHSPACIFYPYPAAHMNCSLCESAHQRLPKASEQKL